MAAKEDQPRTKTGPRTRRRRAGLRGPLRGKKGRAIESGGEESRQEVGTSRKKVERALSR